MVTWRGPGKQRETVSYRALPSRGSGGRTVCSHLDVYAIDRGGCWRQEEEAAPYSVVPPDASAPQNALSRCPGPLPTPQEEGQARPEQDLALRPVKHRAQRPAPESASRL